MFSLKKVLLQKKTLSAAVSIHPWSSCQFVVFITVKIVFCLSCMIRIFIFFMCRKICILVFKKYLFMRISINAFYVNKIHVYIKASENRNNVGIIKTYSATE